VQVPGVVGARVVVVVGAGVVVVVVVVVVDVVAVHCTGVDPVLSQHETVPPSATQSDT